MKRHDQTSTLSSPNDAWWLESSGGGSTLQGRFFPTMLDAGTFPHEARHWFDVTDQNNLHCNRSVLARCCANPIQLSSTKSAPCQSKSISESEIKEDAVIATGQAGSSTLSPDMHTMVSP